MANETNQAEAKHPAAEETTEPTRSQRLLERWQAELADWSERELRELRDDLDKLIAERRAEPVDAWQLTPSLWFWLRQVAQHEQVYQRGEQSAAASYYWQLQQLGYVEATATGPENSCTRFRLAPRGREVLAAGQG